MFESSMLRKCANISLRNCINIWVSQNMHYLTVSDRRYNGQRTKPGRTKSIFLYYKKSLRRSELINNLDVIWFHLEPNNRLPRLRTPSKIFKLKIKSEAIVWYIAYIRMIYFVHTRHTLNFVVMHVFKICDI